MFFELNRYHLLVFVFWQLSNFLTGQFIVDIFSIPIYPLQYVNHNGLVFLEFCSPYELRIKKRFLNQVFEGPLEKFKMLECYEDGADLELLKAILGRGAAVGALLFGFFSDKFGRKRVSILILILGIASLVANALTEDSFMFFVYRFITGMAVGGVMVVNNVWVLESVLPKQRMVARGLCSNGWTIMGMTALCYLTREWSKTYLVSAVCLVPALLLAIYLPESCIWLHAKNKFERTIGAEKRVAQIAGIAHQPVERQPPSTKTSLRCIVSNLESFKIVLTLVLLWCIASLSDNTYFVHHSEIKDQRLFHFYLMMGALIAVGEFALLLLQWNCNFVTRKWLYFGSSFSLALFVVSKMLLFIIKISAGGTEVLYLGSNMFLGFVLDSLSLSTAEQIETNFRCTFFGFCVFLKHLVQVWVKEGNARKTANSYMCIPIFSIILFACGGLTWLYWKKDTRKINLDDVRLPEKKRDQPEEVEMMATQNRTNE